MNIKSRVSHLEKFVPPVKTKPLTLQDWTREERSMAIDLLINEVRPWPAELQRKRELTDFGQSELLPCEERRERINSLLVHRMRSVQEEVITNDIGS